MKSKIAFLIMSVAALVGCSGPRISPGTKLVDLAPACSADNKHDYQSEREDPESKLALEQAGAMGVMVGASAAAGAAGTVAAAAAIPLAVFRLP